MIRWAVILIVAVLAGISLAVEPRAADNLGIVPWHRAGLRGHGITVAVLDIGFRGYTNSLGSSLPRSIHAKSFRFDGNMEARKSQHGVLCGEIVHALAPEAELLFVDWQPDSRESFLSAIEWARNAGAKIITCSVAMPAWSDGEGGGHVHAAIKNIVGDDVLCVACAGNLAKRHWSGEFRPDKEGWHRWPNGDIDNIVTPWGDETISLELCSSQGAFEVLAFDEGGRQVGRAATQDGCCALRFTPRYKARYYVRVRSTTGGRFHLSALSSWIGQYREHGSIMFPGDGSEWLTIGAWESGHRADYSSCGPNSQTQKPDLVATVPFTCQGRAQPFGGTSAAAPQAAGLAALFWSRHPHATVTEVKAAMRSSAVDVARPGIDDESGWGLLKLPALKRPI